MPGHARENIIMNGHLYVPSAVPKSVVETMGASNVMHCRRPFTSHSSAISAVTLSPLSSRCVTSCATAPLSECPHNTMDHPRRRRVAIVPKGMLCARFQNLPWTPPVPPHSAAASSKSVFTDASSIVSFTVAFPLTLDAIWGW